MKLKNVKAGLRVQIKTKVDGVPKDTLGTVTEVLGSQVCVHWDDPVDGWSDDATNVPTGHGWAVSSEDLRKLKE